MNQQLQNDNQPVLLLSKLQSNKSKQLLWALYLITTVLLGFEIFLAETDSLVTNFSAVIITIFALLPSYLWCSGKALGMPIFPLLAITYVWTYALPLVTNHPKVSTYSPEEHLFAGITVAGFLGLGTLVWFSFVKSPPSIPKYYRTLNTYKGDKLFLSIFAISVLFYISVNNGSTAILENTLTAVRAAIIGLTTLANFVLAYRLGAKKLSKIHSRLYLILLVLYMITNSVSLLLIGASTIFIVATAAFIIGRRKIPIIPIVIVIICLSFLHAGKAEMRTKYWSGDQPSYSQPWEYPQLYAEWVQDSLEELQRASSKNTAESSKEQSFLERSSVIQMLLLSQTKSPNIIPYLSGKTYELIPQLVIPRIFNSNKIRSHEGTAILNVHYGLQKDIATTYLYTIGWGLLPEAYANFGLLGCSGLAIVLGIICGKVCAWSINAPILSAQSLFSVLFIGFALQTEWSAGVYVAALSQSGPILGALVLISMKKYQIPWVIRT
ncbi:MAG: hypothetical protein AAF208_14805 [Cyanobacteria bacterium P01_A01_bin.45]